MAVSDSQSRAKRGAAAVGGEDERMHLVERLRSNCGPGTRLRPRRGQIIDIAEAEARTLWLIESGCVLVRRRIRNDLRQVLVVLLPGDVLDAAWSKSVPGLELMATTATQLVRTQAPAAGETATDREREADAARTLLLRQQLVWLAQHATCLGPLTGEERIAALLSGLAHRQGREAQAVQPAALPLSRRDLAECLALNPDTVSRILSELRRRQVLAQPSRNEIVIKDGDALARMSPL